MSITSQIQKDIVESMKARQELRLSTLRMAKAALKYKEIDKHAPLDEKEEIQVLSTLIKQRHDSNEQFIKGNRPELAAKELEEIVFIECYLPKAVGVAEIALHGVRSRGLRAGTAHQGTDLVRALQKLCAQGLPDEPAGAGDQHAHGRRS